MSEHITEWLNAYLDSELHGEQLRKVEVHLTECQTCQAEYRSLQALSELLQKTPKPDSHSLERFTSNVILRLPHNPVTPLRHKALEFSWWMVPVGLLSVWIFISTTTLVSNMVSTANEIGLLNSASTWLVSGSTSEPYWSATLGQFGYLNGSNLQWAEMTEAFTRIAITQITWQVSIALLYLSWIAIWWARHTRREHGQPLESGSMSTVE